MSIQIQSIKATREAVNQRRPGIQAFAVAPNLHMQGKGVVVMGNSPALKEVDLSVLDKVVTIGINRVGEIYDPSALLFTDAPIYYVAKDYYDAFKGPIFTWHGIQPDIGCLRNPEVRYFNLQPVASKPGGWRWPTAIADPLIREGTTPPYAIQLAVLSGAKAVGILGVDHSAPDRRKRGQDTHFFGTASGSWHCKDCSTWLESKSVVRRNRALICPECRSEGNLMRLSSTGGHHWTDTHKAFFNGCQAWAQSRGTLLYNLSPYVDTPIHRAGWPKMTCEEFADTYA